MLIKLGYKYHSYLFFNEKRPISPFKFCACAASSSLDVALSCAVTEFMETASDICSNPALICSIAVACSLAASAISEIMLVISPVLLTTCERDSACPVLYGFNRLNDQFCSILSCLCAFFCKAADFFCHNGKSSSGFTGAGCFNCSI